LQPELPILSDIKIGLNYISVLSNKHSTWLYAMI
jgi:hypothetical protein